MNLINKIVFKIANIWVIKKIFGLDKLRKRKIFIGLFKGLYIYGNYNDKACFFRKSNDEKEIVNLIEKKTINGNFYDIGAYYGFYSLLLAKKLNQGKVYTFEPNPITFNKLRETIKVNKLEGKVELFNFALGDKNQELEMEILLDRFGRSTCDERMKNFYSGRGCKSKKVRVGMKVLDDLNLPGPSLVKMDVEGCDQRVIKGMLETIKNHLPDLIIEVHGVDREDKRENATKMLEIFGNFGYSCLGIENSDVLLSKHLYFSTN